MPIKTYVGGKPIPATEGRFKVPEKKLTAREGRVKQGARGQGFDL